MCCFGGPAQLSDRFCHPILPYSGIGQRPAGSYHRISVSAKSSDYPEISGGNDLLQLSMLPSLGLFFYTMSADRALTLVTGCFLTLMLLYFVLLLIQRCWKVFPLFKINYTIRQSVRICLTLLILAGYAGFGYRYFVRHYKRSERIMLKAEEYVKSKEWEKVLTYTSHYWRSGRTNQLIAYFYHLALYHTGQLPYRLLDFPQVMGVKSLYFRGIAIAGRVNTVIFCMRNWATSMKRNAGSLKRW